MFSHIVLIASVIWVRMEGRCCVSDGSGGVCVKCVEASSSAALTALARTELFLTALRLGLGAGLSLWMCGLGSLCFRVAGFERRFMSSTRGLWSVRPIRL